jgi:hypothetical protein
MPRRRRDDAEKDEEKTSFILQGLREVYGTPSPDQVRQYIMNEFRRVAMGGKLTSVAHAYWFFAMKEKHPLLWEAAKVECGIKDG